jgi:nucleoside-diphosphate-sugar epimerase
VGNDIAPILVTGASGYLGGHVLAKIKEKVQSCVAVSRRDCDLTDIGAVRALLDRIRPSVIVHCAALVPKASYAYDDIQAAETSVAMVKAVAQTAACPVVFASSMTVYTGVHAFPVHEDIAISPQTGYAHGKWLAEQVLFKRNFKGDVALRLPGLFGLPRRSGLLYNAAKSFLAEGKFEPDIASHSIWAAMGVQDAAEYMVRAALVASSGHPPQPINVGYEGKFSVLEAVAEIATQCGLTWEPHSQVAQDFLMCLDRLKQRYGLVQATFRQRLAELIEVARHDLLADGAGIHNA